MRDNFILMPVNARLRVANCVGEYFKDIILTWPARNLDVNSIEGTSKERL